MKQKCALAVLFGGKSSEYEVSLSSAHAVLDHVDPEKYELTRIGITRDGRWYLFEGETAAIADGTWCREPEKLTRVAVNPASGSRELLLFAPDGGMTVRRVDAVFPVLHGAFGEDGTLQGMLSLCGIPVVGCGCASSAVCMDKTMTKAVLNAAGVRQARSEVVRREELADFAALAARLGGKLGYPLFVKPARAGSSVGISKVKTESALLPALEKALREDDKLLVEECIVGRETEVAVLEERGKYTVSAPAEIEPGSEFYDYETKYYADCAKYYIPARLSPEKTEEVRRAAEFIFRTLDCRGLARVDFFVTAAGEILLNEVNTLPGFTPISMYPKLMTREGMNYGELIDRLVAACLPL